MDDNEIKHFIEAALLAAGRPLSVERLQSLFDGRSTPEKSQIREAIGSLTDDYADRGITISEVASGYRIQVKAEMVSGCRNCGKSERPGIRAHFLKPLR